MEWLWDEWAEGVVCGAIGVYVHVQGVVRACVRGQEVRWCIIWRGVGESVGCVVGGGQRGS